MNDDTVVIGNVVRHRYEPPARLLPPPGVEDFDKECGNDPNVCSEYANDIFNYYKSREVRIHLKIIFCAQCVLLASTKEKMHQGQWLNIKFGFPQTGKGSQKIFEFGWQTAWEINF